MKKYLLMCVLMLALVAVGCSKKKDDSERSKRTEEKGGNIIIAAASSYNPLLDEIGEEFKKEYGYGVKVTYGATGDLVDQIKNGAPFDILVSADKENIDKLENYGSVDKKTITTFAKGSIGIAVRKDSDIKIEDLKDLENTNISKIGIANPKTAPYGEIAKSSMENVGIYKNIEDKIVYGKNISEVPTLIETKNVDVGIIPITTKNDNLKIINIDKKYYKELPQVLGMVKDSKNKEVSKKFIEFLAKGKGKNMILEYGYEE